MFNKFDKPSSTSSEQINVSKKSSNTKDSNLNLSSRSSNSKKVDLDDKMNEVNKSFMEDVRSFLKEMTSNAEKFFNAFKFKLG